MWAYYEAASNYNNLIAEGTMINAIASAFGGVSGAPGDPGTIWNNVQSGFPGTLGTTGSGTLPAAFLTYVLYDQNFNKITAGWQGVTANGNTALEHLIQPQITIEQPGYIYVIVYNRSNSASWVYFDDLKVVQTHSTVVAASDYYPFGLVMDGRQVTDVSYRYGYQGQYAEKDNTTGWNEFDLRMYDSRFGRWISHDPYGQFASPYLAMGNSPQSSIDPDGGYSSIIGLKGALIGAAAFTLAGAAFDDNFKDNWWMWTAGGAAVGSLAGTKWFRESVLGHYRVPGVGDGVIGRNPSGSMWQTLASIDLDPVKQKMSEWCVFACSEAINKFYGGKKTKEDYSLSYNGSPNTNKGVTATQQSPGEWNKYYGKNFKGTSDGVSDLGSGRRIANHLRKNRVISVQIDRGYDASKGQRNAHNVLIKSIQRNSKSGKLRLMIMDPDGGNIKPRMLKELNKIHISHFIVTGL